MPSSNPRDVFLVEGIDDGTVLLAEDFTRLTCCQVQQRETLDPLTFKPRVGLLQQIAKVPTYVNTVQPVIAVQRMIFARKIFLQALYQCTLVWCKQSRKIVFFLSDHDTVAHKRVGADDLLNLFDCACCGGPIACRSYLGHQMNSSTLSFHSSNVSSTKRVSMIMYIGLQTDCTMRWHAMQSALSCLYMSA